MFDEILGIKPKYSIKEYRIPKYDLVRKFNIKENVKFIQYDVKEKVLVIKVE